MSGNCFYKESISSKRTEALFVVLAVLFLLLSIWRVRISGFGFLTVLFLSLFGFFVFYLLNYRVLTILMNRESLELRFGVFSWTVPWSGIEGAFIDDTPIGRIGGAGIHFTMINRRYRVYLNFLEFPRVVLTLKKPRGLVRDVAFSTSRPSEVLDAVAQRSGCSEAAAES